MLAGQFTDRLGVTYAEAQVAAGAQGCLRNWQLTSMQTFGRRGLPVTQAAGRCRRTNQMQLRLRARLRRQILP